LDTSYDTTPASKDRSAYMRAYRAANRERINERARLWRATNAERSAEIKRRYRVAHPELVAAQIRKWNAANYDAARSAANVRQWRAANPEANAVIRARYRTRKKGASGTHTLADVRTLYNEQDGLCFWCGCELGGTWHVDHLEPLSRGGGNGPENLAIACPPCNLRKKDTDPMTFLERVV